jgi:hypothetical protein
MRPTSGRHGRRVDHMTGRANVPATASRLTYPRRWTSRDWLADALPHAAYGIATVLAYDVLSRRTEPTESARRAPKHDDDTR